MRDNFSCFANLTPVPRNQPGLSGSQIRTGRNWFPLAEWRKRQREFGRPDLRVYAGLDVVSDSFNWNFRRRVRQVSKIREEQQST